MDLTALERVRDGTLHIWGALGGGGVKAQEVYFRVHTRVLGWRLSTWEGGGGGITGSVFFLL